MSESFSFGPRRIQVLPELVYQKIAAGEVIDRPASVLRELMDNSIDAGSGSIDVYISKGGIEELRVVDNGLGMSKEDLELSILPHATSKISSAEDLQQVSTLGFRGEALASIAASSRLEIISSASRDGSGRKIYVESGKLRKGGTEKSKKGTTVSVRNLFYSLPARKQFLKSPAIEQKMCRQVFIEKALPFCNICFRLFTDGKQQLFLPAAGLIERGKLLFSSLAGGDALFETDSFEDGGIGIRCLLGNPSFFRRDRRYIYIYINNRKIDEYGLVQAVEYGYGDYLPKGRFPYAFVFLTLPPESVDFNIHPAKREVRLRDGGSVHRSLHSFIRSALLDRLSGGLKNTYSRSASISGPEQGPKLDWEPIAEAEPKTKPPVLSTVTNPVSADSWSVSDKGAEFPAVRNIQYIGQIFSLFLLAADDDIMYCIDQHAAHERYIYDKLNLENPSVQDLLVPLQFETDPSDSAFLHESMDVYKAIGIKIENKGENTWLLTGVPAKTRVKSEDIIDFITSIRGNEGLLRKELYARIACRSAVQDGELLDRGTGLDLVKKALNLPVPQCPHGRPVWHRISRDELFSLVGRKI